MLSFFVALLYASPGSCHGVEGYVEAAQGYRITAQYDDGEPVSYAAVEIKAPGDDIVFQAGRTDRNGIMLFQPDQPGHWQAVVTDGMGHRLALGLEVTDPGASDTDTNTSVKASGIKAHGVITGMAMIFGVCGALYGWRGRRPRKAR